MAVMPKHSNLNRNEFEDAIALVARGALTSHDGGIARRKLPISALTDGPRTRERALNVAADALAKLWKQTVR
jgi:hypothetical protein